MSSNSGSIPGDVFDVSKVRKFIELMNEHDLAEIDLRQGDQRIRLRRARDNDHVGDACGTGCGHNCCSSRRRRQTVYRSAAR